MIHLLFIKYKRICIYFQITFIYSALRGDNLLGHKTQMYLFMIHLFIVPTIGNLPKQKKRSCRLLSYIKTYGINLRQTSPLRARARRWAAQTLP